jgi:lysozyme
MLGRKFTVLPKGPLFWAAAVIAITALPWVGARHYRPTLSSYPQQGVDVRAANGPVSWQRVKAAGATFAYVQATTGDRERDSLFAENWQGTAAAGLKRGAIHDFDLCRLARDQATNFITTVPREAYALPAVVDLELNPACTSKPARSVVVQEVAAFIRLVEAHTEKPMVIRVSRSFEKEYAVSRALDRPLWLSSFMLTPSYGERPWIMWRANGSRAVDGINGVAGWSVVRP